jgi:hypothetical protein
VKNTNHRLIAAVDLVGFTDAAIKGICGPKASLGVSRLINEIRKNNNIAVVMRLLISSRYKLPFRLLANPANGTYL